MNRKNKRRTYMLAAFFLGMLILSLCKGEDEYSASERRKLKSFPEISWSSVTSGRFMDELEDYLLDQFPFREQLRSIKAWMEYYVFQSKNINDIYVQDGIAAEMVYPLEEESVLQASKVMKSIYDSYLKETEAKVYFSMIPDKNYFLAEDAKQLSMDYREFFSKMKEETSYMQYIDITNLLTIEDYYRTDSHWKQECLIPVAGFLTEAMGNEKTQEHDIVELSLSFYGVYAGQWMLPLKEDTLSYVTNEEIRAYRVYDYENGKTIPVYDLEKAAGDDGYEMYLGGSLSLITIENEQADTEKELILFRDSFGSSIAPLLAEAYAKVTLVDIRYLPWERLEQFIDFDDQDVLFLYSTAMLNHKEIR